MSSLLMIKNLNIIYFMGWWRKEIELEKLLFLQKDNPQNLFGPDPAFANANVVINYTDPDLCPDPFAQFAVNEISQKIHFSFNVYFFLYLLG